jgi:spoIIIJ-associated protein
VRLQLLVQRAAPTPPPTLAREVEDEYDEADFPDGTTTDEDAEVARVVLGEILEKLSIRASVTVRRAESSEGEGEAPWLLNVTGSGDLSVLIGKRGETLASLQYLTRLITSRELQRRANIVVDVDSYKARRTSKLQELALRMAEQAVREQRTISLEPMPPYERRIIHMALRDREDVSTRSVGEGAARKITIVPNK